MTIECCHCRKIVGEKDGHGVEGVTSTICAPCAESILPAGMYADFLAQKGLRACEAS